MTSSLTLYMTLSYLWSLLITFTRHKTKGFLTAHDVLMFIIAPFSAVGVLTTMLMSIFINPDKKVL